MATSINGIGSAPSSLNVVNGESDESFVVIAPPDETNLLSSNLTMSCNSGIFANMPQGSMTENISQVTSVASMSLSSELSASEIQQKLESLLTENLQLKDALHQNNLQMKKQFSTLVMWQEDVVKVHQSHKEKFEETKKLISSLRTENSELKKAADSAASLDCQESLNMQTKISALEFELETLRNANIKYKEDQAKIVQELEMRFSASEKQRNEENLTHQNVIESLNSQLKSVEEQYNAVKKQLIETKSLLPSEKELAIIQTTKEELINVTTELLLKNKMLKEKTDLTDELVKQVSQLKIENETIPILQTQTDLYRADFTQERDSRSQLKEERDKIAEDLHQLQQRNAKLLEQIEIMQRDGHDFETVNLPENSSSATHTRSSPPLASYRCPICSKQFRTARNVEEHVDLCLLNNS